MGLCLHCGNGYAGKRPRGLCCKCYLDAGIRCNYACTGSAKRRKTREEFTPNHAHKDPEPAVFSSHEERLQVLALRVSLGLATKHELDQTLDGVPSKDYEPADPEDASAFRRSPTHGAIKTGGKLVKAPPRYRKLIKED